MVDRESRINECMEFLRSSNMLVMATQGADGPYTSLMAYCCSDDGMEVYMITRRDSTKWANLINNPQVSLLVDDRDVKLENDRENIKALTVTGVFAEVSEREDEEEMVKCLAEAVPSVASLFSGPECSVIRIKVLSFLLLDGPDSAFYSGIIRTS
ncbi:pyridoxamine 5'-phosphate oxidase family protein [Maridesulfovibrio sp. FT414]|uniref:pyridoxamine 5'-phosphate oxidase family protein n=1 Tax=Maridesulfovibrio sp. FT414 TaxID=2979469 RepID=UPI003D8093EB